MWIWIWIWIVNYFIVHKVDVNRIELFSFIKTVSWSSENTIEQFTGIQTIHFSSSFYIHSFVIVRLSGTACTNINMLNRIDYAYVHVLDDDRHTMCFRRRKKLQVLRSKNLNTFEFSLKF